MGSFDEGKESTHAKFIRPGIEINLDISLTFQNTKTIDVERL